MSDESGPEIAVGCIAAVVAVVVGSILRGLALSKLWGWFVVPVFHLPALAIVQAIGLSLVVGAFVQTNSSNKSKGDEKVAELVVRMFILSVGTPLLFILFGWVLKGFL